MVKRARIGVASGWTLLVMLWAASPTGIAASLAAWLDCKEGGVMSPLTLPEQAALTTLFGDLLDALPDQRSDGEPDSGVALDAKPAAEPVGLAAESAGDPAAASVTAPRLASRAGEFGWSLVERRSGDRRWWSLAETAASRRGQGCYLLARGASPPVLLQIPHRFTDRLTGELGLALLLEHPFRGAAFNSLRRDVAASDGGEADLARRADTALVALSLAFARREPQGLVVQLHGFAQASRRTLAGRGARLIVSNGSALPGPGVIAIHACLRGLLGSGVALYPWDVNELGATRNPVGKALRDLGHPGFVHLELSARLRQRLVEEASLRDGFAACLLGRGE